MVDKKEIREQLEEIEEIEDKIEFLKKLFKEAEDDEEREQIIEIAEELFPPSQDQALAPMEQFSTPGEVFKPVLSMEQPLEQIIAPVKTKEDDEGEKIQYATAKTAYSTPTDVYTTSAKAYTQSQYEPATTKDKDAAREELEEEKTMRRESDTDDLSDTINKETGRREF